jgi:hypothetical protein
MIEQELKQDRLKLKEVINKVEQKLDLILKKIEERKSNELM